MRYPFLIFSLSYFCLFLSNCNKLYQIYENNVAGVELTDENIQKYVKASKALHTFGKDIPKSIAEKTDSERANMNSFQQIEGIIKEAGFKDFPEFVKVNAKVAWAWNVSQGELGINQFQTMKDEGLKQIEETLNNPSVSEETKAALRKLKDQTNANWEYNKKYADIGMGIVKPLTNSKDLEVIKRNQKELMEAYTGIPVAKLKEIDPSLFIKK